MQGRLSRPAIHVSVAVLLVAAALATTVGASGHHRPWSLTSTPGPYAILPATPENFTVSDGVHISYAVHMPAVPAGTRVPVVLTMGPYFALSEEPVHVPSTSRLSGFLIENLVPHGYAVVAASVRGTGWSGGCMELMSLREARDADELVTFLATRPWSTGAVGVIGKSYDGGVAWEAAQFGNPAVKTIVPIAGVSSQADLMYHRGVPESRAATFHALTYWPYGFGVQPLAVPEDNGRSLEDRAANAACPEVAKGAAIMPYSTVTGDTTVAPLVRDYWAERDFVPEVLANYTGSVFVVHGLQDWNVKPRQFTTVFNDLAVPKKAMLGQWGHHYPDEGEATNRGDFADVLKAWFDRWLKGASVPTGPTVEVADATTGAWRSASAWPPAPVSFRTWHLAGDDALRATPAAPFRQTVVADVSNPCLLPPAPTASPVVNLVNDARYGPVTRFSATNGATFRLSGEGVVEVTVDPATAGSVAAVVCAGNRIVAHGAAHMLYADGTNDPAPYVPGQPHAVRIELEGAEATVFAGERVTLALRTQPTFGNYEDDLYFESAQDVAVVVTGGTLTLPVA